MIEVPPLLAEMRVKYDGEAGRAFVASLPDRVAQALARWQLRLTGAARSGFCALVVPVVTGDGVPAALKIQVPDDETSGEPLALRAWDGRGAVRLLRHGGSDDADGDGADPVAAGTMLLEAADPERDLWTVPSREAIRVIAGLLVRLTAVEPPAGLRTLGDVAARVLADADAVARRGPDARPGPLTDPVQAGLLRDCAVALGEVAAEPGDRLLHWDLHHYNVLGSLRGGGAGAPAAARGWLAIDPKPLVGDPGFELYPALFNRFEADEVRWRFDLLTGELGLDRERARAWTLGRVLQDGLIDWRAGGLLADERVHVARVLLGR